MTFSDDETLRRARSHHAQAPVVVALERLFAATSRGAALINRIKADPTLRRARFASSRTTPTTCACRGEHRRRRCRRRCRAARPATAAAVEAPASSRSTSAARGARRAFRIVRRRRSAARRQPGHAHRSVGRRRAGRVADVLRPNQRVRMALPDGKRPVRFSAGVAWASFELAQGTRAALSRRHRVLRRRPAGRRAFCEANRQCELSDLGSAPGTTRPHVESSRMIVSSRSEPVEMIAHRHAAHLFEARDVALRLGRQIARIARTPRVGVRPSGHRLVDRLGCRPARAGRPGTRCTTPIARRGSPCRPASIRQAVEHVELRQRQRVEAVDARRVAHDDRVVPAAAARTAGRRAVLLAAFAQPIAQLARELGRQRPLADARRVRLRHAQHAADRARAERRGPCRRRRSTRSTRSRTDRCRGRCRAAWPARLRTCTRLPSRHARCARNSDTSPTHGRSRSPSRRSCRRPAASRASSP